MVADPASDQPGTPDELAGISITGDVTIGSGEVTYTATRSGGPGGQNVNKVNTRVTLWFDVQASPSLTDAQKDRICRRLATRIGRDGVLRVVSSKYRTQPANRRAALERFVDLLGEALHQEKARRKTAVPRGVQRRRRADKTHRSQTKQQRAWRPGRDD